jgi:hypothetical protein
MAPPKRRANDDEDAWADWHAGDCATGHISQLREQNPPGEPFDVKRGPLGFLDWDGDSLKSPARKRKKRNGHKP